MVKQYDVILANLDPTVGSEIKKIRPCVVISPDEMNNRINTIVIAPMTTSLKNYPSRVEVKSGGKVGMVALDQVRTIDKSRILKILGAIKPSEILEIKQVIKALYVD